MDTVNSFWYHRGQDWQEERCRGDVAGTLSERGNEEAEDDSDGPGRDGVERSHLITEPVGQTGLLPKHEHTHCLLKFLKDQFSKTNLTFRNLLNFLETFSSYLAQTHTSLPLARAKPPPSSRTMFQGIFFWVTCQVSREGAGPRDS